MGSICAVLSWVEAEKRSEIWDRGCWGWGGVCVWGGSWPDYPSHANVLSPRLGPSEAWASVLATAAIRFYQSHSSHLDTHVVTKSWWVLGSGSLMLSWQICSYLVYSISLWPLCTLTNYSLSTNSSERSFQLLTPEK